MASRTRARASNNRTEDLHAWTRRLLGLFDREHKLLAQLEATRRQIDLAFGIKGEGTHHEVEQ
jgi:hypothetical protein